MIKNIYSMIRVSYLLLRQCGIGLEFKRIRHSFGGVYLYIKDLQKYRDIQTGSNFPINSRHLQPYIHDRYEEAGQIGGHYFHQDIWAAKKIKIANPSNHYDIGSRMDGFISHLLVFRDVNFIDIRPMKENIKGLSFVQDDATTLSQFEDGSVESLSSLHVIEHFGLGRYGDPIDPDAHIKFANALQRVLKPGGKLYISTPCGIERLCFNAHRVFNPQSFLNLFPQCKLVEFSCVMDNGEFIEMADIDTVATQTFGLGLFELERL